MKNKPYLQNLENNLAEEIEKDLEAITWLEIVKKVFPRFQVVEFQNLRPKPNPPPTPQNQLSLF